MSPEAQIEALASRLPPGILEGKRWLFDGQWIVFDPTADANAVRLCERILLEDDASELDYLMRLLQERGFAIDINRWTAMLTVRTASPAECTRALLKTLQAWKA